MTANIENLQESEAKYRAIFEASKVGLVLCEMDGSLVECNQSFLDIIEYTIEEALSLTYWDITPREYEAEEVKQLLSIKETGGYGPYEKQYITKSGKRRPVLLNGSVLKGADGKDRVWSIVQDISDRIYIEGKLKSALDAAEIANRSKSEFLSSMSHELRTPMNAIIGFGQLLQFDTQNPLNHQQKGHIEHILKGGKRLLELVEHVLDLSKIETGNVKFSAEDIQLNALCVETLNKVRAEADERNIQITKDLSEKAIFIKADYDRVQQSLLHLLSNAVKYNHFGGSLTLKCQEVKGQRARVTIEDTGEGIALDRQSGVFEPFNRLGKEASATSGTGIGLNITKQLVEAMGGEVGYESELGAGSSFWIEFPQYQNTLSDRAALSQIKKTDKDPLLTVQATVLYIEDDISHQLLMQEMLGICSGISVLTAHSAELGLAMAEDKRPDLILMDINLPGMSGNCALGEVLNNEILQHIPMVAITARAMDAEVKSGLEAGFKAYLTKPFDVPKLFDILRQELVG